MYQISKMKKLQLHRYKFLISTFLYNNVEKKLRFYITIRYLNLTNLYTYSDISKIKDGMSDKVSMAVQWIFVFLSGFGIAFAYEWRLTLVIMSTSPLLAIGGYFLSKVRVFGRSNMSYDCYQLSSYLNTISLYDQLMSEFTNKEQNSYAVAGGIAEEVIGAIRTVISFGAEKHASDRYNLKLKDSEGNAIKNGMFSGLSMGFMMMVMFGTYGLAFW